MINPMWTKQRLYWTLMTYSIVALDQGMAVDLNCGAVGNTMDLGTMVRLVCGAVAGLECSNIFII